MREKLLLADNKRYNELCICFDRYGCSGACFGEQMNKGLANKCVKPVVIKLTSSSTMSTSSHKLNDVRIMNYSV